MAPAGRTAGGSVLLKQGLTAQWHTTMLRTGCALLTVERCKMYITDMAQDKAKGTSTRDAGHTPHVTHDGQFPLLHAAATSLGPSNFDSKCMPLWSDSVVGCWTNTSTLTPRLALFQQTLIATHEEAACCLTALLPAPDRVC